MTHPSLPNTGRRRLLALLLVALGMGAGTGRSVALKPARAALPPTPRDAEGPFYTPGSPQRTSLLEEAAAGTRLVVTGRVLSTGGAPLTGAKLDFWHTDAAGSYDNRGFRFRGHQYTDAGGRYRLETVVPGPYPGRTRHIHVKVAAAAQAPLTTQLYFPDEPRNRGDFLFKRALLLDVRDTAQARAAQFDFVLAPR